MIYLSCSFDSPIGQFDLEDYLRHLMIKVSGWDEEWNEVLLGRICADLVDWMAAEIHGESRFDICDQDSQGWYEVHEALIDRETDDFREDLNVDGVIGQVLFVYDLILAPAVEPHRQAILEAATHLFGEDVLTVMWRMEDRFSAKELAELGFRKIAEKNLIYRHNCWMTDFARANPRGVRVEFEARSEHETWVREELRRKGYIRRNAEGQDIEDPVG